MRAKQYLCLTAATESRAKIWCQENAFGSRPLAAVCSGAVVLLLSINCLLLL